MGLVTKTYISKSNTIIKGNMANTGLNPVLELNYGKDLTRALIYFDHTKLQTLVEDKTYPDISKLKHILKMTNTSSIVNKENNQPCMTSTLDGLKDRATSFDLIFFLINKEWDEGKGFDYIMDMYNGSHAAYSTDGSNWYYNKTYFKWDEEGVYMTRTLSWEMDKATNKNGNLSDIIFAIQHFDFGNENIEVDITPIVNMFITGELENYGIGIAFSPAFEETETERSQYVGFFSQHTHTFFEPYIETTYDETIEDDRLHFYLDKDNKLYFYSIIGSEYANLDELPECSINGVYYEVKQATKGVYYIDANLSSDEYEDNVMLYDIWSNIKYNGKLFKDVELSFVTSLSENYFSFGLPQNNEREKIVPSLYGINHLEEIHRGNIRKVNVDCRVQYTSSQMYSVEGIEYRIFTKEGLKQYDVVPWQKVERGYNENYFFVNTEDYLPGRYYIDIKVKQNSEIIRHLELLTFDIVEDVTDTFV